MSTIAIYTGEAFRKDAEVQEETIHTILGLHPCIVNYLGHQENVQLYFGNLHFDIENFEQLCLLYGQLSLQEYIFDFDF